MFVLAELSFDCRDFKRRSCVVSLCIGLYRKHKLLSPHKIPLCNSTWRLSRDSGRRLQMLPRHAYACGRAVAMLNTNLRTKTKLAFLYLIDSSGVHCSVKFYNSAVIL